MAPNMAAQTTVTTMFCSQSGRVSTHAANAPKKCPIATAKMKTDNHRRRVIGATSKLPGSPAAKSLSHKGLQELHSPSQAPPHFPVSPYPLVLCVRCQVLDNHRKPSQVLCLPVERTANLSKDDLIDVQGTVVAVHSGGLYRVQVDSGHEVLAQLSGRMRRFRIKVVPGDRVTVGVSPYDPVRGIITFRAR